MVDPRFQSQLEWMSPPQIEGALAHRAVVYLPLGTYEWHGRHLPIGLDALKAHGICLRAVARTGGVVCPPLYYGIGGEHANYPWTIILDDAALLEALVWKTLERLEASGARLAVILTGHFPGEQVELLNALVLRWRVERRPMGAISLFDGQLPQPPIAPDHAALYETSLMGALEPAAVDLAALPAGNEDPPDRHDPAHPLWGIFGQDPRHYDTQDALHLLECEVNWLVDQVEQAWAGLGAEARSSNG